MKQTTILGLAVLLISSTSAIPLSKRDLVIVTEYKEVYQTVNVVETVWVNWSPTAVATTTTEAAPIVYVAPTTSSVAPIPITTEASTTPVQIATSAAPIPISAVADTTIAPEASSTTVPEEESYGMAERGTTYTGDITYYATGLGSCGITSGYYDSIVAISHVIMDAYNPGNPNNNPLCGNQVMIQYNGRKFPATVVDRCEGCAAGDLDLSEGFFSRVTEGNTAAGRIHDVTWSWS